MDFSQALMEQIQVKYKEKTELLGNFMDDITAKIKGIEDKNIQWAMKFLYSHLPLSDIGEDDTYDILLATAVHAFFVRQEMPWSKDIPFNIFLSDILIPRVSNERLEDNRRYFYDLLIKRIPTLNEGKAALEEAIIAINYFCYENATYQTTDRRTAPPKTLMKSGAGRCGEESVFTVTALRSMGIPARPVYTPRWAHCDDNHAWVEAYVGLEQSPCTTAKQSPCTTAKQSPWVYLGACEPEEVLNRGWFTSASSRAMLIESRTFYHNPADTAVEALADGVGYNLNHTSSYAHTRQNRIRIVDGHGKPLAGAEIWLELINYGGFAPIALLYTDQTGEACITTGLGSLNIHIVYKGAYMEKLVDIKKVSSPSDPQENGLTFIFVPESPCDRSWDFNTYAPIDPGNKVKQLSKAVLERHKANMENGAKIREEKLRASISTPHDLANIKVPAEGLKEILEKAKGNGEAILGFLSNNPEPYAQGWAWRMLQGLTDKDYTDLEEQVLQAHLRHALQYEKDYPEDIFSAYILSPRIHFEPLRDYRQFINNYFDDGQRGAFRENPAEIWTYIQNNIKHLPAAEFDNLAASPISALKTGYGSPLAQKILFVAIARTFGIPARIRKDTADIEYYGPHGFTSPIPAEIRDAVLSIAFQDGINWTYGVNWSIGRLDKGIFKVLNLRDIKDGFEELALKSGWYRVLTVNRLPNGDVFARGYEFQLIAGKKKDLTITLRPIKTEDMRCPVEIGDFYVSTTTGEEIAVSSVLSKKENIIIWLKENHEPCNHILNELIEHKDALSKINVVFIAADAQVYENALICKGVEAVGGHKCVDKEFANQEPVARRTYVNPENLPLAVAAKGGLNSIFATSGYNVGTVDLLIKLLS